MIRFDHLEKNLYFLLLYRSQDIISVGDFGLVLSANMTSVTLLLFVMKEYVQFNKRWGQVSGALKALFETPYKNEIRHEGNLHVSAGEIVFSNVSFAYVPDQPLFCDLNITIKPGEKVALVGYSGSGKTTFFHLLLGLYEIQGGKIFIDKQDINSVKRSSLYDTISIIPQEAGLFFRSIRENICYGSSDINEEFMIESSKRAHAHEFISQLQDGYDTCLDENGIRLSGGQKQRIAIARALYKNAPLLFLDEATSQLDTLSEQFVQDGIQQAMKGKTVLVIAHRLSTLLSMERILVFEGGKIVQDGTHSELVSTKGLYQTLWNAQSNGKILDNEELNESTLI